jgi:hypothetical protein
MGESARGQQGQHILQLHILLLEDQRHKMVANEGIPRLLGVTETLPVKLPQVGLAVLDLDGIVLKETHLEVLLVDVDGEGVADVLDGEVLADGLELRDEEVVGSGGLLVLAQEVGEC